jgi:hypothetical protein|tara:strand:+ start:689 stop:919 length:231 start_codon:yes stop_codon:yes gene_type:complete
MSGMCTSDSTMSKSRRRSRSAVSASAPRVNVVTGVWLKGGGVLIRGRSALIGVSGAHWYESGFVVVIVDAFFKPKK